MKIVVGGMIAAVPGQGGATWAVLQYLLGFARLGHEVTFVEVLDGLDTRYLERVMRAYGLDGSWSVLRRGSRDTAGLSYAALARTAHDTDVLIDISGTLAEVELFAAVPIRAYLDVDPAFTQLWDAEGLDLGLAGHTHFVTVGQSIRTPSCTIPDGGRHWLTTLPPVVLEHWPVGGPIADDAFTSVANWRSYGTIDYAGVRYGQKAHSLRELMDLATRTPENLLLALAIDDAETADLAKLRAAGWQLTDPAQVAGSPAAYHRFVSGSKAEFGLAKEGYVRSRSGWFSDRSACYLAAGRPVLAQDTGFSEHLPTGDGVLSFSTTDEALDGIAAITADYARHAAAARTFAEEHLDSDKILTRLLDLVGARS